jgi:hypothetical protein
MKRIVPFLIACITFFMTSCGNSSMPQNSYATQMQPAIEQLTKWQAVNTDLESLLTDSSQSSTGMSRIQMIELYNLATEYKITRDDYVSMGFQPLDMLVGDAHKTAQAGHGLLNALAEVTPVQETEAAHHAVVKCIQERVAFAEGVEHSLKELDPIDLKLYDNATDCSTFDANLEKLTAYVNNHK